jgi:branched-chain amino acid transport system permease protein
MTASVLSRGLELAASPGTRLARYVVLALLLVSIEPLLGSSYLIRIANWILILSIAALGANVVNGYAGLVSIAHAAFMAAGAYVCAIAVMKLGIPFVVAAVIACVACGLLSGLIGWLGNRVEPVYFLVVTLGIHVSVLLVIVNEDWITGGANGLSGIPAAAIGPLVLSTDWLWYPLIVTIFTVALYLAQSLRDSRAGRAMAAGRLNLPAANASGIDINRNRITAMVVGGVYFGVAGSVFAFVIRFLGPENFSMSLTLLLLLIVVVGGLGSNLGTCVSVLLVVGLTEVLRGAATTWVLLYGIFIMVMMVVAPRGLADLWYRAKDGVRRRLGPGHEPGAVTQ